MPKTLKAPALIIANPNVRSLVVEPGFFSLHRSDLGHALSQSAENRYCFLPKAELVASIPPPVAVLAMTVEQRALLAAFDKRDEP